VNTLLTLTPEQFCAATQACAEGRKWAITQPTMADVWDHCPRGDWLLWLAKQVNAGDAGDDRTLRLFAVWCARSTPLGNGRVTGDLLTDPRSLAALEVAERYAHGLATTEELATAYAAAYAAARAYAYADTGASAYAAAAAAYAYAAYAYADTGASAYADTGAYADAGAYAAARLAHANQFRLMVKNPFPRKEAQP
jgi:hypothetical protein